MRAQVSLANEWLVDLQATWVAHIVGTRVASAASDWIQLCDFANKLLIQSHMFHRSSHVPQVVVIH